MSSDQVRSGDCKEHAVRLSDGADLRVEALDAIVHEDFALDARLVVISFKQVSLVALETGSACIAAVGAPFPL